MGYLCQKWYIDVKGKGLSPSPQRVTPNPPTAFSCRVQTEHLIYLQLILLLSWGDLQGMPVDLLTLEQVTKSI